MTDSPPVQESGDRDFPRIVALLIILFATSVGQPTVLLAIPFLVLVGATGSRSVPMMLAAILAMVVAISGSRDGVWYVERAWALLVGAWFLALTLWRPALAFSARAIGAIGGSAVSAACLFSLRAGAWGTIDWAITDRVVAGVSLVLDSFVVLRGGESLSPALVSAIYQMAESQTALFPAITGIASMAGLALAWTAYGRLVQKPAARVGPVREFRFNDHLVWLFIAGMLLLVTRPSEALMRVGSNVVFFMGALYALRGAGVVVFMAGGISFFGYLMTGLGLLLVPPVVVTGAMAIGIGDTWLNVRDRVRDVAA